MGRRSKRKKWLKRLLNDIRNINGEREVGMPEVGDWMICKYTTTKDSIDGSLVKVELWQSPEGIRYRYYPESKETEVIGTVLSKGGAKDSNEGRQYTLYKPSCVHKPSGLKIGETMFYPFSYSDTQDAEVKDLNYVFALASSLYSQAYHNGFQGVFYGVACPDRGTLPEKVHARVVNNIASMAQKGHKVGFYCQGGHGRTGTILASLIALIEKPADPIKEVRERYCNKAVESLAQAKCVFKFAGLELPESYNTLFTPTVSYSGGASANYGFDVMYPAARSAIKGLPAWFYECTYMDTPLLSELDREARVVQKQFTAAQREPMVAPDPGIAPAEEPHTFWLISRKTGAAVRMAFHYPERKKRDGEILEAVAFLPKEKRPYIAVADEPKIGITIVEEGEAWPM